MVNKNEKNIYTLQKNSFPPPFPGSASTQACTSSSVGSSTGCSPFGEIPVLGRAYPLPAVAPGRQGCLLHHGARPPTLAFPPPLPVWCFLPFHECIFTGAPALSLMSSALSSGGSTLEVAGTSCVQHRGAPTSHRGQPCSLSAPPLPPKLCHVNPIQIAMFLAKAAFLAGFF